MGEMERHYLVGSGVFALAMLILAAAMLFAAGDDRPRVSQFRIDPPTDEIPNPLDLRAFLLSGDFDRLDREFTTAQARYRSGGLAETMALRTFHAFGSSDPALQPALDRWVAARPGTWPALLARGLYRERAGWLARGASFAGYTPPDNFVAMREKFAVAKEDLTAALALNPYLTAAHGALIAMARADSSGGSESQLLAAALADNPASFAVRVNYLTGLQPKWGGSRTAMRNFTAASMALMAENPDLRYLDAYLGEKQGEALYRAGDYAGAIAAYTATIAEVESSFLYFGRGRSYMALRNYGAALADMNRGLVLKPFSPTGLRYRAEVFLALGRTRDAFRDFELAVEVDPLNISVLLARSTALDAYHRFDEAIRDIDRALVYASHDPAVWIRRGRLHADGLRDHTRAVTDFEKAIELRPGKTSVWWYYGMSLAALDRCDAISALRTYRQRCDAASWCSGKRYSLIDATVARLVADRGCAKDQWIPPPSAVDRPGWTEMRPE